VSSNVSIIVAVGLVRMNQFRTQKENFLISAPRHICVTDCVWCSPDRAIIGPRSLELYLISYMSRPARIKNFQGRPDGLIEPRTGIAYGGEYYQRSFCFDYEPVGETSGQLLILYRFRGIF
jgi:hypothetical protein